MHSKVNNALKWLIIGLYSIQIASADIILVLNTEDSGVGSLRQAILDANQNSGLDDISFNIPEKLCSAEGVCQINLLSNLPEITDELVIDGTTQTQHGTAPANVCATENSPSYMRIEILGSVDIFTMVSEANVIIKGLSLGGNITFTTGNENNIIINCNHIGINAQGDTNLNRSNFMCFNCNGPSGSVTTLGTNSDGIDDIAERNVISSFSGVYFNNGSNSIIAGNYFGLSADGITTIEIPAQRRCLQARQNFKFNRIGSNLDGINDKVERNIFGSCGEKAVEMVNFNETSNIIAGNWIGVNANGESTNQVEIGLQLDSIMFDDIYAQHQVSMNWIDVTDTAILLLQDAELSNGSINNCITNTPIGVDHMGSQSSVPLALNYWGDASGPSGIGTGTGAMIIESASGTVDFKPWIPEFTEDCFIDLDVIFNSGFEI
ncbi:MAG: hypothetical protein AB8B80_07165 [Marinicellaceae bacterium]